MKLAYLFSENILFHMAGHIRNLFYHPDMIYIFPSNYKVPSVFNYVNNENTVYYDNEEMLYSIVKDIDILFVTENFKLKYFFPEMHKTNKLEKYEEMLKHISIYFIHHGITGYYKIDKKTCELWGKTQSPFTIWTDYLLEHKNTFLITCCNFIQKHVLNLSENKLQNQIIKVNHIPQFSYNHILYNNGKSESELEYLHKSVVIFPVFHNNVCTETIQTIVKNLIGVNKNIIIKLKPKVNYKSSSNARQTIIKWQDDLQKSLNDYNGINVTITSDSNNAQYFHCDKIITINGGTSFFEALTYNNKTFNIQFTESFPYQKLPGIYNKLLICNDINEFKTKLDLIKDKNYFDNGYEKEKEKLFALQIGSKIKKENNNDWDDIVNEIITRKC